MPYRLHDLDDLPEAVRGVARERLSHAAGELKDRGGDAESVHSARKDLKKTRSLLRLVRPGIPKKAYRARNDELREIAASLERAREAEALAGAVEALAPHADGRVMPEAFADLAAALRASAPHEDAEDRAARALATADRLYAVSGAVSDWPLDGLERGHLRDGIALAYERGVRDLAAARAEPTSDVLHEWRKRVKDLWYHARLLRPAAPGPLQAIVDEADRLADVLGDEHDLAILADRLDAGDATVAGIVVEAEALRALIDDRRVLARDEAGAIAGRLYAERPKAFRRRIGALVDARPAAFALPARSS